MNNERLIKLLEAGVPLEENEKAMQTEQTLYGVYSQKQSKLTGVIVYSTPDGGEVRVTEVSHDPELKNNKWDDKEFVGVVCNYLRRISDGSKAHYFQESIK